MKSLDPRVTRLPEIGTPGTFELPSHRDQLITYEVFVQPKDDKPFQHEGIVHASDLDLAFLLAKETFTRRFTCVALCVTKTTSVHISPITEETENAYDRIAATPDSGTGEPFEIYHLLKRGKQHIHAGTVTASSPDEAFQRAKSKLSSEKNVFSIWAIAVKHMLFSEADDKDLWMTLPEKRFRDAVDYKGGDKLKDFLATHKFNA